MGRVANKGIFLAVIGSLALFGAATFVQADDRDRSNETVLVCVKANGGPVRVPGSSGCNPSEESRTWVVGGDISTVRAGEGLIGGSTEGEAALGIDPSVFTEIKGGFKDSGAVPEYGPFDIAIRKLTAGDYAMFAKLTLANTSDSASALVDCSLWADSDADHSSVRLEPRAGSGGDCPNEVCDSRAVITLALVHTFEQPGEAVVRCRQLGLGLSHTVYNDLKIVAIRGVGLSNVQLD